MVRYSPEIADQICYRLAEGESLRAICTSPGMPDQNTVRGWMLDDVGGFAAKHARARELQAFLWADEIVEIVDDATNDWMDRQRGNGTIERVFNREHYERSRLRADTRKWMVAKLLPKVYGDKIDISHAGSVTVRDMTDEQLDTRITVLLAEAQLGDPVGGAGRKGRKKAV